MLAGWVVPVPVPVHVPVPVATAVGIVEEQAASWWKQWRQQCLILLVVAH